MKDGVIAVFVPQNVKTPITTKNVWAKFKTPKMTKTRTKMNV